MTWYGQSEEELRALVKDVNERTKMQTRLEELRKVNYHGVRCHMSEAQEQKLKRALGDTDTAS